MLVACSNLEQAVEEKTSVDGQDIKVNFVIKRANFTGNTKAKVKSAFADGDKIFLLFAGVAAPKYLELSYNSGIWASTAKNGLVADDLSVSGKMTAIYLPYGSDFVVAKGGKDANPIFTIKNADGADYSGHFYVCQRTDYTFNEGTSTLTGTINLVAAAPKAADDKLVHFDVSGYNATHTYAMCQEYMKPISLTKIAADGSVTSTVGGKGGVIPGFVDAGNSIVSFSGVLDASVVGSAANYSFYIYDNSKQYYRAIDEKTINGNMYIGLGALNDGSKWSTPTQTQGVFSVSDTKIVNIASSNLVYRGTETNKWQLMQHPWSMIDSNDEQPDANSVIGHFGWATSGYNGNNPWNYSYNCRDFGPTGLTEGQDWTQGSQGSANWDWGVYNTTNGNHIYEYGGETALTGTWRTLTIDEWMYLLGMETYEETTYDPETNEPITTTTKARDNVNNTARYRRSGLAIIHDGSVIHKGLVLIPDNWTDPQSTTFKGTPNSYFNGGNNAANGGTDSKYGTIVGNEASEATNYYTIANWIKMEAAGAIFLPGTGNATIYVEYLDDGGEPTKTPTEDSEINKWYRIASIGNIRYWSSTATKSWDSKTGKVLNPNNPNAGVGDRACCISLEYSTTKDKDTNITYYTYTWKPHNNANKNKGRAVRLVRDVE